MKGRLLEVWKGTRETSTCKARILLNIYAFWRIDESACFITVYEIWNGEWHRNLMGKEEVARRCNSEIEIGQSLTNC